MLNQCNYCVLALFHFMIKTCHQNFCLHFCSLAQALPWWSRAEHLTYHGTPLRSAKKAEAVEQALSFTKFTHFVAKTRQVRAIFIGA